MSEAITLYNLRENLQFFRKMYDAVRLVDPVEKSVCDYLEDEISRTHETCYHYWDRNQVCDNCISIRAGMDNKSYIKFEYNAGNVIMITVIPVVIEGEQIVVEMLKNVTDSMMFGIVDCNKEVCMSSMIAEFNSKIVKDPLTSLYNRRYIDERLPADIVSAVLCNMPLSLVFLDLDDFKRINDVHGHIIGDDALKAVGSAIQGNIRKEDWAARYGGDEFVICFNNTTYDEAENICSRIREHVENSLVGVQGADIYPSISFGIQTMHGEKFTAQEMLVMADKKMYADKKSRKGL